MSPCSPNDLSVSIPEGSGGIPIPGFGVPYALKIPNKVQGIDGFPENLMDIFNKLQLLLPPGIVKPTLHPNFSKHIYDGIMDILDQFFPFLMMYKFFLPILKLVICIIEVLCAIPNPFKLIRRIRKLFRNCIPEFLNLFPIFSLIIMIISLLLLIIALIEYMISQIIEFIKQIVDNIFALYNGFNESNDQSVLAATRKLGSLLCIFQNFFVLFAIMNIIVEVFTDLINMLFAIPPCDNTDPNDADGCCTPDVCPAIVQENIESSSGQLQYVDAAVVQSTVSVFPSYINGGYAHYDVRSEGWQFYDRTQFAPRSFFDITDAADIPSSYPPPRPIFFPTDVIYNAVTPPRQAAYTVDLQFYYDPVNWFRSGIARTVQFKNCIVTSAPSKILVLANNTLGTETTGVLRLAGGLGYENDGVTPLTGYAADGVTSVSTQATLENFLHKQTRIFTDVNNTPVFDGSDGYTITNIFYIFKPNLEVLLHKQLVTVGCEPSIALNRTFMNGVFLGDLALKTDAIKEALGVGFPQISAAQDCLTAAFSALRNNMTPDGAAQCQTTAILCLEQLRQDTENSLVKFVSIGVDACSSTFSVNPSAQFTSKTITVSVDLKGKNGVSLAIGLPSSVGAELAIKLKGYATFGEITNFIYDGYQYFTAEILSKDNQAGNGQLMISFDNNILCTNTIPDDTTIPPSHDLQALDYQFVYSSRLIIPVVPTADEDALGVPRRDVGDLSRDSSGGNK